MPAKIKCGRFYVKPSQCACPSLGKYPIQDARHVRNAAARFAQRATAKCPGGAQRICAAARKHGIESKACKLR
jgi:hypothetical protein